MDRNAFLNFRVGGGELKILGGKVPPPIKALEKTLCLFPRNLGDSFVSLLVEPIVGKNRIVLINICGDFRKTA